ncbi:uncharacterized protein FYW23_014400 isoform 1-T1 [Sylvia borin]
MATIPVAPMDPCRSPGVPAPPPRPPPPPAGPGVPRPPPARCCPRPCSVPSAPSRPPGPPAPRPVPAWSRRSPRGPGGGRKRRPAAFPGGGRGRPGRSGLPGVRRFPALAEAAPGRRSRDIVTGTKEKEPAPDGAGRGHRTPWALPPSPAVAAVYCGLVAAFFGAVKAVTFRLHARLDRGDPEGDPEGGAAALLPPRSAEERDGSPGPPGGGLELSVLRWPSATPPQLCGFNQLSELLPHLDTASGAGELRGILTAADRDRLRSVGGGPTGGARGGTPAGAGGDPRTPLTLLHPPPAPLGVPPGSPPPSPPQGGGPSSATPPGPPP